MDWELLQDMLTSDFWTLGGTSSFFSNATEARLFAENKVYGPYPDITPSQRDYLDDKSEEVYNQAMLARGLGAFYMSDSDIDNYGYAVSDSESAHYYWTKMIPFIDNVNNQFLSDFFRGQADINLDVIEYKKEGIINSGDTEKKIPWWVFAGVGLIILNAIRR